MALLEQTHDAVMQNATEPEGKTASPLHPVPYLRALPNLDRDPHWPQMLASWMNEFKPDSPTFEEHVRRAAEADLILRREQTRFDNWNGEHSDPENWDSKVEKKYRLMKLLLDGAHRAYNQWFKVVDSTRRNRLLDGARLERSARAKAKDAPPPKRTGAFAPTNTLPFIQVISIRRIDGELKTSYCPTNQEILGAVRKADHPRITVRRRFMLQQDLPVQYDWVRGEDGLIPRELNWTMTKEEFEADAEEEQADGTGYVLPSKNALAGVRTPTREIVLLGNK